MYYQIWRTIHYLGSRRQDVLNLHGSETGLKWWIDRLEVLRCAIYPYLSLIR
jgi:hypothetical protein